MAATTENGQSQGKVAMIPVNKIRENQVALRTVDRESEEYLGLVDSIREKGVLNAILVREIKSPETGETLYGLIDGLHRWNAAQDAGLKEVPAQIRDMEQAEIEEAQIVANVHKIDTKPVEYTKQLVRLMTRNPLLTVSELSKRLSKSPEWLYARFGLLKLDERVAELVDEGKIKLSNAYQLAKLPKEEQANFVEKAMVMQPGEFTGTVTQRVKEVREARRQGRAVNPPQFEPVPHQRKWSEVRAEFERPVVGSDLIKDSDAQSPLDGWNLAIAWVANMDPKSKQNQIDIHEAEKKAREEAKKRAAAERAEQRQKEAQERAEKLRQEANAAGATQG